MGAIVSVLGVTSFSQSLILVCVSASVTGLFALLVVFVQTHFDRELHKRMDALEGKGSSIETKTDNIEGKVTTIEKAVTNGEET